MTEAAQKLDAVVDALVGLLKPALKAVVREALDERKAENENDEPKSVSVNYIAKLKGKSPRTVNYWIKSCGLKATQNGGGPYMIEMADFKEWWSTKAATHGVHVNPRKKKG